MPINDSHSAHNHVVVTPHGQTVRSTGGGNSGPTDVVDTSAPVTSPSSSYYAPVTKGSIAGYTGFIPGRHHEVGLNYRSASNDYYTELERQSHSRQQARDQRVAGESTGGGNDGINDGINTVLSPSPAAAPAASDAGLIDNKYSRYATQQSNTKETIPISGYGGFVPNARTTHIGVGTSFTRFANEGFSKMHDDVSKYSQRNALIA